MMKRDLSISIGAANLYSILIMIPLMTLLIIPYGAIWGWESFLQGLFGFVDWISFIPVLLIGVPAHEMIHAFSWALFGKVSFKEIQFGLRSLTPYAHCKTLIQARAYRLGAFMPALLQGLLPYIFGLVSGNGWFTSFGLMFILAASGDFLVLWTLRNVRAQAWVEDHPARAGCYVMDETGQ